MLDLHRARILREVARHGSMTAAARSLACTQRAVSHDIAFATEDHVAIQQLVARGLAVATLPEMALCLQAEPGVARLGVPEVGRRRIAALVPAGPTGPGSAMAAKTAQSGTAARGGVR